MPHAIGRFPAQLYVSASARLQSAACAGHCRLLPVVSAGVPVFQALLAISMVLRIVVLLPLAWPLGPGFPSCTAMTAYDMGCKPTSTRAANTGCCLDDRLCQGPHLAVPRLFLATRVRLYLFLLAVPAASTKNVCQPGNVAKFATCNTFMHVPSKQTNAVSHLTQPEGLDLQKGQHKHV